MKQVTKESINIKKASTDTLKKMVKRSEDEKVSPTFGSQLKLISKELQKRKTKQEFKTPAKHGLKRKIKKAFLQELVRDMIQVTEKKKGVDGKACWKGYRYAGTKNGKDVCIKAKGVNEHETDPNLELTVGDYQTQHYHMCPGAKTLYQDIESKVEDMDLAVRTAKLQDALFAMEEEALDSGATETDLFAAETIAAQIMDMARMMGLENEHNYIQGHVDKIKGVVK